MKNSTMSRKFQDLFKATSNGKRLSRIKILFAIVNTLIAFLLLYAVMFANLPFNLPQIQLGRPSPLTVITPKTVTYVDEARTNDLYEKIKSTVKPVYRLDIEAQNLSINSVKQLFVRATDLLKKEESTTERAITISKDFEIDYDIALTIVRQKEEDLLKIQNYLLATMNKLYISGIRSDALDDTIKGTETDIDGADFPPEVRNVLKYLLRKYITANLVYDERETQKAIGEALKNVPPIRVTIEAGTTVVAKGEIVTEEEIKILNQIGVGGTEDLIKRLAVCLILSVTYSLLTHYAINSYCERNKKSFLKKYIEYFSILITSFVFLYVTKQVSLYLFPLPLFVFMVYAFTSLNTAIIAGLCFSFLFGIGLEIPYNVVLPIFTGILFSLIIFRRASKIINYLYGGIVGGATYALSVFAYSLYSRASIAETLTRSGYAFANIFIYTILSLGLVFIFEHLFNEITVIRLLELSNTDNPLLREMLEKAPGTYQHSMLVASVASAAAEAIGANPLLAKVGAYYHDIGKMLNPLYFTENQNAAMNIHNSISPFLSKSIIINHVKDGVALAKRLRLPQEIIDFIDTHHGKTVISYFYQKAKDVDPSVSKDDFRYPGELPKTKETAILLLTDAVEAASHSLDYIDYRKLDELTRSIINDRIEDGQLVESELTFSDISKIRDSFVKSLLAIYHRREKYPVEKEKS